MEKIASLTNQKIKMAASLAKGAGREKENAFVAEGVRMAEEAAHSGWPLRYALVTDSAAAKERVQAVIAALEAKNVPVWSVSEEIYRKAAQVKTPQGIMVVVEKRRADLADIVTSGDAGTPLVVVLDGVQDPGNVGTILRTAEAIGATGAVLLKGCADIYGDKVIRASMGALFRLPVAEAVSAAEFIAAARESDLRIFATALDETATPHLAVDFAPAAAVAFGSEGSGVTAEILAAAQKIYIPMVGGAESFNVAQASAIVLYETLRQRKFAHL